MKQIEFLLDRRSLAKRKNLSIREKTIIFLHKVHVPSHRLSRANVGGGEFEVLAAGLSTSEPMALKSHKTENQNHTESAHNFDLA